jgi:23S rRNA (guanosine2251-2'-O)-methyltransferase
VARRGRGRDGRAGPEARERLYGIHPVREALRAGRRPVRRLRIRAGSRRAEVIEIVAAAVAAGIPVEESKPDELTRGLEPGANHQGVVLETVSLPEIPLAQLVSSVPAPRSLVALDGVEDPQNVGAIVRVAEAAGVGGLLLTRRRAPPLSPVVARASAGALEWLPAARVTNLVRALKELKSIGFWVFGADPTGSMDVFALPDRLVQGDRVVVLGAEGRGLRPAVARALDHPVRVPMAGRVASLNVAAAAAVLLFELGRRADSRATGNFARTALSREGNPSASGC